ncbi:CRISPR-associated helicase Cas3' [Saccharopolyspora hirsuta]|uniref:CRISPR-associated helicase Cas3 n=1 Tax=Saccharopolyspora hirsuta TaxID=1837 RepID=A0A5M7CIU0_SACHI|nr:CRISPR-associated helicase Cas3' [Saccharopolyspora hirsuta]
MWAHSVNSRLRRHLLSDHARETGALARRFAGEFGAGELGFALGLFHDAGKARGCWQRRLLEVEGTDEAVGFPHKDFGARWLVDVAGPAALAILGHHGGLTSVTAFEEVIREEGTLEEEVKRAFLAEVPEAEEILRVGSRGLVPVGWLRDPLTAELGIRLVFSALVDADHLDTAAHFDGLDAPAVRRDADMGALLARFEQQRLELLVKRGGSPIDAVRERVYRRAVEHASQATGIYRMPAPTGIGKTLSSAGFALHHAALLGKKRVIVAVPFITVTEQNAKVYRSMLGTENVLEHHSAVTPPESGAQGRRWRSAAENWDSPFVVTTTVQLFDSLFGRKPSQMRKLHRLANSVLILDEVQALPLRVLVPILDALRVLSEQFGTTVLLTSATQPSFEHLQVWNDLELPSVVDDPVSLFEQMRRVSYEWWLDPKPSLDEVADTAGKHEQVLVVVNTVKDARKVYQRWVSESPDATWHLSARMCAAHRRAVLDAVRERLDDGLPVRLVSTQLIEAGVDVDFPVVYRAMAPAESLQQAAGRANREAKLPELGKVVIFDAHDMSAPAGYTIGTGATRTHFGPRPGGAVDPDDLPTLSKYYRTLFQRSNTDEGARSVEIQRNRAKFDFEAVTDGPLRRSHDGQGAFRDRELAFRMLDDETISVVATGYAQQAADLMDQLRADPEHAGHWLRKLQPFLVSLPRRVLNDPGVADLCTQIVGDLHEWCGAYDTGYGIDTSCLVKEEVW